MTYSKRGTTEEDEKSDSVQCEDNVEYVVWDGKYAYMPTAPGNLRNKVREQGFKNVVIIVNLPLTTTAEKKCQKPSKRSISHKRDREGQPRRSWTGKGVSKSK